MPTSAPTEVGAATVIDGMTDWDAVLERQVRLVPGCLVLVGVLAGRWAPHNRGAQSAAPQLRDRLPTPEPAAA